VLGRGSYATVYLGRDTKDSNTKGAIKVLSLGKSPILKSKLEAALTELAILVAADPKKEAVVEIFYYEYIEKVVICG